MTNSRPPPAVGLLLSRYKDEPECKHDWKYRTLTGMLGYFQGTSRPDISMSTHQCTGFNANPKLCHKRAVKRIVNILSTPRIRESFLDLIRQKGLNATLKLTFPEDEQMESISIQRQFSHTKVL